MSRNKNNHANAQQREPKATRKPEPKPTVADSQDEAEDDTYEVTRRHINLAGKIVGLTMIITSETAPDQPWCEMDHKVIRAAKSYAKRTLRSLGLTIKDPFPNVIHISSALDAADDILNKRPIPEHLHEGEHQ